MKNFIRAIGLLLVAAASVAFMTVVAPAQTAPSFRLCTGDPALNYFKAGHILKSKATSIGVQVLESRGSLDNLDKVTAGDCDGAFVQSDALLVYSARNAKAISGIERAGVLYQEHAHLLCNRNAGIDRIVDLSKDNTVAIGPDGSGARTTWTAFVLADNGRYGVVQTDSRSGVRALAAVSDGSQVQCMLSISALNAPFFKGAAAQVGDRVILAGTDDGDMKGSAKDARGQSVYDYSEIPAGTYPDIQPAGAIYGTKDVGTIVVNALFVVNTDWINANERAYDSLLRAFSAAKPQLQAIGQPQG